MPVFMSSPSHHFFLAILFVCPFYSAVAELVDITSQGTASQTSEWNGGLYPAANAIDGDPGTFSHTDANTPNNAWEWSQPGDAEIRRVDLIMRGDCCAGRLSGATVRLFDSAGDSVYETAFTDPGIGQTVTVNVPWGTLARSLRVGFENGSTNPNASTTLLHFGEIRVLAEIDLLPEILAFTASSQTVTGGQSTTLSWQTDSADMVEIIGIGAVAVSGTNSISPVDSVVYTLIASNAFGSRSANVSVLVDGVQLPPRITEFIASNTNTIVRSDGSSPDWIEIWNPNPMAIDLAGYRFTDDGLNSSKFIFPATTLAADTYLVVDAAEMSVDGVIALGFSLKRDEGSYLAWLDPAGAVLQSFTYPKQREDVSYGIDPYGAEKYFLKPTPGGPGVTGTVDGFVADTQFSVGRGFYTAAQTVAITTETPQVDIYFTTDGSEPTPGNSSASVYTAPLNISTTTVLRAAAYRIGYQSTDIDTQTYIFTNSVASQSDTPSNFPLSWVANLTGSQAAVPAFSHFGMNDSVLASLPMNDSTGQLFNLDDALRAIPTMSLVIDADVLFDPATGLHANALNRGRAWERPASIEFIDPATGMDEQANCGLRMHGGWNRYHEMLKKSFRLYFRSEYGDSKFRFPLFPDSNFTEFDGLILRSGNGKAWASPWRALSGGGNSLPRTTYARDQFSRDLQAATGNVHIPGRFVHLYINGHYWGLYNPVERPNENFASARYGGDDDDYDVIKWLRGTGHRVAAGNDMAWNQLIALIRNNPASKATYDAVAERLDLTSFVDYMLVNFYTGNSDWVDNNVYAMRNRAANGPFRFYCWDSEESLLNTGSNSATGQISDTCTEIHHALRNNAEYRILFADRAQKHFFNGGALTLSQTDSHWTRYIDTLDRAIVAESARWGSLHRPASPYNRADWTSEVANIRTNYLGSRIGITLSQLTNTSLFPNIAAPLFAPQRGGQIAAGTVLTLSSPGNQGTVYYSTDGSDPRLEGGGISPKAIVYSAISIQMDTLVKARVLANGIWSPIDEALYIVGDRAADLYVSEIMYNPLPGGTEFLEIANRGTVTHSLSDLVITGGIQFSFGNTRIAPGERIVIVRGEYAGALGNGGDTFSLEMNDGTVLWTLTYDDTAPGTDGGGRSLTYIEGDPNDAASWRPSVASGGSPGTSDSLAYIPGSDLIAYAVSKQSVNANGQFEITQNLAADGATITVEWSEDLTTWSSDNLIKSIASPETLSWELGQVSSATNLYFRARITTWPQAPKDKSQAP